MHHVFCIIIVKTMYLMIVISMYCMDPNCVWPQPHLHKASLKAAMFVALTDFYGWMFEVKFLDISLVLQLFSTMQVSFLSLWFYPVYESLIHVEQCFYLDIFLMCYAQNICVCYHKYCHHVYITMTHFTYSTVFIHYLQCLTVRLVFPWDYIVKTLTLC